ncbi:MAG: metal-sulfur cluster assembly factor [bacterium]|nr:metal-sulfur cluster assembly factor [bacterium]
MVNEKTVYTKLKTVFDPELHINIVDLGLIYDVRIEDSTVKILMTLTFSGCPLGALIHKEINEAIGKIPGVKKVELEITFNPSWDFSKVSETAREQLGLI